MENKFSITFKAKLKRSDKQGFEIESEMDSTIVGEYSIPQLHQIAMEATKQFGELLGDHVHEAQKNKFSLD